jgi:hypothetical protein
VDVHPFPSIEETLHISCYEFSTIFVMNITEKTRKERKELRTFSLILLYGDRYIDQVSQLFRARV